MNSNTGSLGLMPMNSKNDTARIAGVSEEDVIANTVSTGITPQHDGIVNELQDGVEKIQIQEVNEGEGEYREQNGHHEIDEPIKHSSHVSDTIPTEYKFAKSMSPMSPRTRIHVPSGLIPDIPEQADMVANTEKSQTDQQSNRHTINRLEHMSNNIQHDSNLSGRSYNTVQSSAAESRRASGTKPSNPLINKDTLSPNNLSSRSNTNTTTYSYNSASSHHASQTSNTSNSNNIGTINSGYSVNQSRFPQTSNQVNKTTTFNTQPEVHSASVTFQPPERSASPFRDPTNLHLKQINDQQRPMYTPAVLRVMKNDVNDAAIAEMGFDVNMKPSERPKLMKTESTASLRSTASSVREYWNYLTGSNSNTQNVPGPTRNHWKPDSSRFNCTQCRRLFNYMTESRRKHHCRSCGDLFCGDCLKNYIYLDQDAKFTLFGSTWDAEDNDQLDNENKHLCKVCHNCFRKYEEYVLDHTTRDHNLGTDGKDMRSKHHDNKDAAVDRQNLPVDWDWSSF